MRTLGLIIGAGVLLCALQYALIALSLIAICLVLWGVITQPANMMGFIALLAVLNVLLAHPLIASAILAALVVAHCWQNRRATSKVPPPVRLLPPPP